jgi:dolichol-phosphate mannosyltransferase
MLSIIIPTLNEKDTILKTISEIKRNLKNITYEIIVVDDNSPDKTWKTVQIAKIPFVSCIRRIGKKSLSLSIKEGFSKAKFPYLLVLDADGQHEPKIIKEMLKQIPKNDFVIGSRFTKNGSAKNWSKNRLLISKTASLITFPLISNKLKDPMAGFFMTKKEVFEKTKKDLKGTGYKIFLEMFLSLQNQRRVKISEIPYNFKNRKNGKSKINIKVIKSDLSMILRFYYKKFSRFSKFLIVGFSGLLLNTFLLWFLTEKIHLFYLLSGIIATETAIISNFLLNNFWTWKNTNKKPILQKLLYANLISLLGLTITITSLWVFTYLGVYYLLSNLIGILFSTYLNFTLNNKITFKNEN